MNVFVIPSWFPLSKIPNYGRFAKEQAEALAEFGCNVVVSLWGQEKYYLNPKNPTQMTGRLANYINVSHETSLSESSERLAYVSTPCLEWTHKVLGGNFDRLLEVNRVNLSAAIKRTGTIDVIHAHVIYPGAVLAHRLAEEVGIPYVVTTHMGPFPFPKFLDGDKLVPDVQLALEKAGQVVAVSSAQKQRVKKFGTFDFKVVPNLVDDSFFIPDDAEKRDDFTIFSLGRLTEIKGCRELLKALICLKKDGVDSVKIRFGGEGPLLSEMKATAAENGLNEAVTFLGKIDREVVRLELQQCSVFALASHHETFGIAYAEALACGRPIIATKCGGPEDMVTEENGVLVDIGDVEGIFKAIKKIQAKTALYDSRVIREDFMNRFSRKAVVDKLMDVYSKVCP